MRVCMDVFVQACVARMGSKRNRKVPVFLSRVGVRTDICMDMRIDQCVDMCVNMCVDMCVNICVDMRVNMCMDMRVNICIDMHTASKLRKFSIFSIDFACARTISLSMSACI